MSKKNLTVKVTGMTCVNCALNLERAVKKTGIEEVAVNFSTRELHVVGLKNTSQADIYKAVKKAGFDIELEGNKKSKNILDNILLYLAIAIATYFMIQMLLPHHWFNSFLDLGLGSIALAIGWFKFGKGAINSVISGSANMYVLILMGASLAYLLSIYLMIYQTDAHLYFEAAAVIIALVLIGNKVEDAAIHKTTESLSKLANITIPKGKRVIDGDIEIVSVNEIKKGDSIQVNTGDAVPTDGEIISGNGSFNEALLTGESVPLYKSKGATVMGGTLLIDGNVIYKVTKEGHESALAQISKLVQKASSEKANIQRYADKISAIFVPVIIATALAWFIFSLLILNQTVETAFIRSVTILVVSCPCAMGLATPIAVMVGLGKMTEHGILTKKSQAIENLANIKNLLLDKTGTITTGNFEITNFKVFKGDKSEWQSILKSIEKKSSHPIAVSIVKALKNKNEIELTEIEEVKGGGMLAKDLNGNTYKIGNKNFTEISEDIFFDNFILKNNELVAAFNLSDEIKPNVQNTLEYFNDLKINAVILSGDNEKKCKELSEKLNIKAHHSLKPEDKLNKIDTYLNAPTAMVGDGVNDSPALSKVNVGISFSEASNIAVQSADVILLNNDFSLIKTSHQISVFTVRTIKQNLFWAFAYNIVAIPMAAFGVFSPMVAAFLMLFSDLVVVGNSFLLKRKKIKA